MRAGTMSPDLWIDSWYDPESNWHKGAPRIAGLRAEASRPDLYEGFEWLARRTREFWDARAKAPPTWAPLEEGTPSPEEVELFYTFASMWRGPRDVEAGEVVARLAVAARDYAAFQKLAPAASHTYTLFDRFYCKFDQAGMLVKNGALRTDLALLLGDAPRWWSIGEKWITPIREREHNVHLYENAEWLAKREMDLAAHRRAGAPR